MRVLLAIGCNDYKEAAPLNSAELDAQQVFHALVSTKLSWYDPDRSRLLLSPTLDEVRAVLRDILFNGPKIETFTLFFAGHGGVHAGSFYMWLKDTMRAAQSVSALALADLFRGINEAAPRQTNIIIDACESGGLVDDLGVLLKPELLGDVGTPALTLVAMSGRNQAAGETAIGGLGTNALLDCIEGRELINDTSSALIARPMETITVLLKAARLFNLEEVYDEALWRLDGVSFSAYMPTELAHFNEEIIHGGKNFIWTIGHDVFRTKDFIATWPSMTPAPSPDIAKALSVLAALTLPDRQPWFLLDAYSSDDRRL